VADKMSRDRAAQQQGSAMVVAMVSLAGLLGLGMVSVLTLGGGVAAAANERFKIVATYAAESGLAAGMAYLREQYTLNTYWTSLVSPSNGDPQSPEAIPGNHATDDSEEYLFTDGSSAWYEVIMLNNPSDPSFAAGVDSDGRMVIRSTGHGPNGAIAILELEIISPGGTTKIGRPCPGYGQRGMAEDNGGRNDCLQDIDGSKVSTFTPGG
jgi:hypothetical protein